MDGDATGDVTLHEAAELLGVHYMTAYRYVRLGVLPGQKLRGVWRVERADLDELRPDARRRQQMVPAVAGRRRRAPWAARLEARLVAGDGRGCWGVVEAALASGADLEAVYLDVLAPALSAIGARWARGELDVFVEHRAMGLASRITGRLGARFARCGRPRGAIVLGAPEGERHAFPLVLLGDLLRAAGFEVSELGADVPADSFVNAAYQTEQLVAVGVSVTTRTYLEAARESVTRVRRAVAGVTVVVGGQAVQDEADAALVGADAWSSGGRDGVMVFERLARSRGLGVGPDGGGDAETDGDGRGDGRVGKPNTRSVRWAE